LARLFERTVEAAVLTQTWDGAPEFQSRPHYVADGEEEDSRIDALVQLCGKQLVIDAKYASAFTKGHLYQVLAYMKMLGAHHGALVYPAPAELPGRTFRSAPGQPSWQVRLHEVDVLSVASGTGALADLGATLRSSLGDRLS
jgi:hypothetical protein